LHMVHMRSTECLLVLLYIVEMYDKYTYLYKFSKHHRKINNYIFLIIIMCANYMQIVCTLPHVNN